MYNYVYIYTHIHNIYICMYSDSQYKLFVAVICSTKHFRNIGLKLTEPTLFRKQLSNHLLLLKPTLGQSLLIHLLKYSPSRTGLSQGEAGGEWE